MTSGTKEMDVFQQVVETFQGNLSQIEQTAVYPLPDLSGELQHHGKYFRIPDDGFKNGLYVDPEHFSLRTLLYEPANIWFQSQLGKRLGREDSHNHVFFGGVWTEPQDSPDGHLQVAVKSVEAKNKAGLLGELGAFQYLGKLAVPTFRPAFMLIHDEGASLGTHFDGPVATMDTAEWKKLNVDERWDELMRPVDTMFMLHPNSLFHCDLYFRNVGFYETGDTVIVDPELMVSARDDMEQLADVGAILTDEQNLRLNRIKRLMSQDFSQVCTSVEANILSELPKRDRPRNGEAKLKLYRQHLYEPYKQLLSYSDTPEAAVLLRVYDAMMVDLKQRARKDII